MPYHRSLLLLPLLLGVCLPLIGAKADELKPAPSLPQWTNRAGQVLRAEPIVCDGIRVTFRLESGREVIYPLTVFPPEESARLRLALGLCEIPGGLRVAWSLTEDAIRRTRAFREAGYLSAEDEAAQIAAFRKVLLERINSFPGLTDAHREALRKRAETSDAAQ